jgi:threonine synthase
MRSVVVMTEGTPPERLYPMFGLGAVLVEVSAQIDPIVEGVISVCRAHGLYLSTTGRDSNPYQSEGNKTIAFEIVEELGRAPDWVVVPVGGGGTVSGIWRGFQDCRALGLIDTLPRMVGVVPRDYNALEAAFDRGLKTWKAVLALPYDNLPPSILVKLAHSYPPDGMEALRSVRSSKGFFVSVTDDEALEAQEACGRREGLFVEPSTGACLAGTTRLMDSGHVRREDVVVAIVSGSGYRETACTMDSRPLRKQSVSLKELSGALSGI